MSDSGCRRCFLTLQAPRTYGTAYVAILILTWMILSLFFAGSAGTTTAEGADATAAATCPWLAVALAPIGAAADSFFLVRSSVFSAVRLTNLSTSAHTCGSCAPTSALPAAPVCLTRLGEGTGGEGCGDKDSEDDTTDCSSHACLCPTSSQRSSQEMEGKYLLRKTWERCLLSEPLKGVTSWIFFKNLFVDVKCTVVVVCV